MPANAHKQASSVTLLRTFSSSPCLRPSCEVAALFWDANIHALLEPQIKGGVPPPAAQWSLCADGSRPESEPRDRGRGWGGGAQHKDTCHPEQSADHDVKRDARWKMYPQPLWEEANGGESTHPCGFQRGGTTVAGGQAAASICPPAPAGSGRGLELWGRGAVTSWAQS